MNEAMTPKQQLDELKRQTRDDIASLPDSVDMPAECREVLRGHVNEMLKRLAFGRSFTLG